MKPKRTILCVDDNEQVLSVRTFLLETRGYRVTASTNPQEALAYIQARRGADVFADSSNLTLITGPSRTADIERTLTIGVQGPRALCVIIVG